MEEEGTSTQIERHVEEINHIRKTVNKRLHDQAEMMLLRAEKRAKAAEVGMTVRVRVPEVARGRADHPNVLGVITERKNNMFRIGTIYAGVLEHLYSRNMFDICTESFITVSQVKTDTVIPLRSAAGMASVSGTTQGFVECNCKNKCINSKCGCREKNVLCNSKCHSSMTCANK